MRSRKHRVHRIQWLTLVVLSWTIGVTRAQVVEAIVASPAEETATRNTVPSAAEPPRPDSSGPVLYTDGGGFVGGEIKDTPKSGFIRWQGKTFIAPFEFPLAEINSIHWPTPAQPPKSVGQFCFELADGDILFGSLTGLDEKEAILDVPTLGSLHVLREKIHRILRWKDNSDLLYLGPNGLTGWREVSSAKGWREEAGQLYTDRDGTTIFGDFGIPARAVIEFEISWKKRLDFALALGVDDTDGSARKAFRFEAWGGDLIVQRELDREADLAIVEEIPPGPGRTHLLAFLDQEKESIAVFSPSGKRLAGLKFPASKSKGTGDSKTEAKPNILPGVRLTNIRGDIRLEQLRIGRWDGQPITEVAADRSRIHRVDGTITYDRVTRFDPEAKAFILKDEGGKESRASIESINSVFLSRPGDGKDTPSSPGRPLRAISHKGARLGGELLKIENGELYLKVPGVQETLKLPVKSIRSILTLKHESPAKPGPADPRARAIGTLEMDGIKLSGSLADAREQSGSTCLAWQPTGVSTPVPLRAGVSGRIVYREPKPPATPVNRPQPAAQPPAVIQLFARAIVGGKPQPSTPSAPKKPMNMHLRTGDTIPCEVTKMDESGVSFKTPLSDSTFVPHEKIKAIELAPELPSMARVTRTKRDRLLTLPRMQKGSPPTHLIRSREGDYLRGRITKMDEKTLELELRLEPKTLPRDRVSRIIWLHADETEPSKPDSTKPDPVEPIATRVQIVRHDGSRMTFLADSFSSGVLSGKSDVLGAVRAPAAEADMILFGRAIEQAASRLLYQTWKLQNAPEPKEPEGGGNGSSASGLESTLVGKPAPAFTLDLLGGGKFDLGKTKGKVVVLDFWATWCGPCMQTMPQVDRVIREFQDQKQDLQLVAVNLQEAPQQITPVLERHKLKLNVALDRDGIIADKYGATAIPQTVIVGRDGNVARLFVGGGGRFEVQLREALLEVLTDSKKSPQTPAQK